ncbi:MAG: hypothetical protein LBF87_04090 [Treponema sp.]|nr:hypothetical protein [Treponema sp.]
MRKHEAQNLQTIKQSALAILSMVQSVKGMRCGTRWRELRYTLLLGFEEHSETMFKLLNDQAIQSLLP